VCEISRWGNHDEQLRGESLRIAAELNRHRVMYLIEIAHQNWPQYWFAAATAS
jgi:hypothetical protein